MLSVPQIEAVMTKLLRTGQDEDTVVAFVQRELVVGEYARYEDGVVTIFATDEIGSDQPEKLLARFRVSVSAEQLPIP